MPSRTCEHDGTIRQLRMVTTGSMEPHWLSTISLGLFRQYCSLSNWNGDLTAEHTLLCQPTNIRDRCLIIIRFVLQLNHPGWMVGYIHCIPLCVHLSTQLCKLWIACSILALWSPWQTSKQDRVINETHTNRGSSDWLAVLGRSVACGNISLHSVVWPCVRVSTCTVPDACSPLHATRCFPWAAVVVVVVVAWSICSHPNSPPNQFNKHKSKHFHLNQS